MTYLLFSMQEPEWPFEHKLECITVQTLQWLPTTLRIKTKVIKACKTSLTPCYLYDLLSYSSSSVPGGSTTPTSLQFRHATAPVLGPLLLLFLLPGKLFPRGLMADSLPSFKSFHLREVCPNRYNPLSWAILPSWVFLPDHLIAFCSVNLPVLFTWLFSPCWKISSNRGRDLSLFSS